MIRIINKLKNRKGFTLIELIVVLAVLAIIAAIAVPRFAGVRDTAKEDSDKATLESIIKLAEIEYARLDKAPSSTEFKTLIEENFSTTDGKILQSDKLKNFDVRNAIIKFDSNGKGTTIQDADTYIVFKYTVSDRKLDLK